MEFTTLHCFGAIEELLGNIFIARVLLTIFQLLDDVHSTISFAFGTRNNFLGTVEQNAQISTTSAGVRDVF